MFPDVSSKSPTSSTLGTPALPENQTKDPCTIHPTFISTQPSGVSCTKLLGAGAEMAEFTGMSCFENSQNQPVESGTCYLVFWKELGFI